MSGLGSADPRQLGPYRLHGVVGQGSTGTTYLARGAPQRGARKQWVAVRALRPELIRDRPLRARLRHEMQAATGVQSPYVAEATGCELDSEKPWIASEFVPGPSLLYLIQQHGPLPESAVRALGGALTQALMALHAAQIAHRDLGAHNVLLAADAPRVVDYGQGLGRTGLSSSGGEPADDIFELGATLVLAASGHAPFAGSMLPMAREDPDLTDVPESLCPALLACLHKTPESRPPLDVLGQALDLAETAENPTAQWLPASCVKEMDAVADASRKMTGRRLFGR